MSTITDRLDEFRQSILLNLGTGALRNTRLPVVDAQGQHPIVAALAEERLAVLLRRVQAVGGFANVFVFDAIDDTVQLVPFIDRRSAISADDAEDLTSAADRPAANATVGMFLSYLRLKPHGVLLPASLQDERPIVTKPQELQLT